MIQTIGIALTLLRVIIRSMLLETQSDSFTTAQLIEYINQGARRHDPEAYKLMGPLPVDRIRETLQQFESVREIEPDVWALMF